MFKQVNFTGKLQAECHLLRIGIQSAFAALLPYLVLKALLTLGHRFLPPDALPESGSLLQGIAYLANTVDALFPLCILLSIAYQLAKQYQINRQAAVVLALVCSTVGGPWSGYSNFDTAEHLHTSALAVLVVPILSTLALRYFRLLLSPLPAPDKPVSIELSSALENTLPLVCAFIFTILSLVLIIPCLRHIGHWIGLWQSTLSSEQFLPILTMSHQIADFLGIQGQTLMASLFDLNPLAATLSGTLDFNRYYTLFVIPGGSGGTLSLLLAILCTARDPQSRRIALFATPFALFNLNEILLFGLPLILSRQLFLPFLAVPLINLGLSWWAITHWQLAFPIAELPADLPVLINAWLLGGGSLSALLLQLFCIVIGSLVYLPFVQAFSRAQSATHQRDALAAALAQTSRLPRPARASVPGTQPTRVEGDQALESIIETFKQNRLAIYYQPKINPETLHCSHFEALLRLEMRNGEVVGPYFLPAIERAGLATVLDLWVCRAIQQHLLAWREQGFRPHLSINLHPESFQDRAAIEEISALLAGENVDFEVVERANLDLELARANMDYLHAHGFRVSLDDFGIGYAGLGPINTLPLDLIKFDKSLIDATVSPRGCTIYSETVKLCRELGMECTAEGVETEEQVRFVRESGVNYIQGFYYAPALPPDEAHRFSLNSLQAQASA